jgi:DNA modification methylase
MLCSQGKPRVSDAVVHNVDCIAGMREHLAEGSVDLTVTSIPFADLFTYSHKPEDLGNCGASGVDFVGSQFGLHLRFFVEQLHRVTRPGTNACIHVQQLVATKVEHGFIGRRNFRDDTIRLFQAGGFDWKGEIVIPKNPQVIAQRQKLHSLLFITGAKDARQLAPAVNDYVLVFQRPGEAPPVPALIHDKNRSAGWLTTNEWIRDAHGVWTDIRETDVLDGYQQGREEGDEKHVCPLQLEVIRRCIRLYTNPGELVMDPFMGIGSTAVVALEQGRQAVGFELKESYHALAERNIARTAKGETPAGQLALTDGVAA